MPDGSGQWRRRERHRALPAAVGGDVLHMALQGRPWNDCKGPEKAALRVQFDTLKAGGFDKGRSELERVVRQIGLIEVKSR